MRFEKHKRAKWTALRKCWRLGLQSCSGLNANLQAVETFPLAGLRGRLTPLFVLLVSTVDTIPVAAETQPAPFDPFVYVEERTSGVRPENSASRVLYINGRGWIQTYEKLGAVLYQVSERLAAVEPARSLVRQLLTAARTNAFERLPAAECEERASADAQILLVFSESFHDMQKKHGYRFSAQFAALLDGARGLDGKAVRASIAGDHSYIRASSVLNAPLRDKAGPAPVYDLRTASASKTIYLSRAIENPWRLAAVPRGQNPFQAFLSSFTPGDSVTVKVSGKTITVSSFPANTET